MNDEKEERREERLKALYQGIALAMPQLFEISCPFRGRTSTSEKCN
jgi:hypothetical protein